MSIKIIGNLIDLLDPKAPKEMPSPPSAFEGCNDEDWYDIGTLIRTETAVKRTKMKNPPRANFQKSQEVKESLFGSRKSHRTMKCRKPKLAMVIEPVKKVKARSKTLQLVDLEEDDWIMVKRNKKKEVSGNPLKLTYVDGIKTKNRFEPFTQKLAHPNKKQEKRNEVSSQERSKQKPDEKRRRKKVNNAAIAQSEENGKKQGKERREMAYRKKRSEKRADDKRLKEDSNNARRKRKKLERQKEEEERNKNEEEEVLEAPSESGWTQPKEKRDTIQIVGFENPSRRKLVSRGLKEKAL